jgi:hypothetical protein
MLDCDWSSDVCSSDLSIELFQRLLAVAPGGLPEREIAERYIREITAEQNAPPPPPPSEESSSEGGEESSEPMDL